MAVKIASDVDSGTGLLGLKTGYRDVVENGTWRGVPLHYSDVAFGPDGVYLAVRNTWVVKEIAGEPLSNCFYVVKVKLDKERLRLGRLVNLTSGTFIKIEATDRRKK
ncbi:conserved within P. aerophilum part 2, authentic frameshift [Pyrobaculum aerophilum str. IM2]|uniref:Conserved within P. aerophilum part 2, authentic frameshift n=2 Tax=Pyrobaculum aerophilum TaxID=13773 RepID=Q8ZTN0_PYRAE|nr:conserved within P. aerophilum part 2, authentic frameshift [Pyrobaculum aerophilum str. IM2]